MKVVVVKYNAGNVCSVLHALERLNIEAHWTDEPECIVRADKVIFPGVGEAASAMRYLKEKIFVLLKYPFLPLLKRMLFLSKYITR